MTEQQKAQVIANFLGLEKLQVKFGDEGVRLDGKQDILFETRSAYVTKLATGHSPLMVTELKHLPEWLSSDAGTVATIEKLMKTTSLIPMWDEGKNLYYYLNFKLKKDRKSQDSYKTLNAALQAAVMEVIDG